MVVNKADEAMICAMMLMNMPMTQRHDPSVSAFLPYSLPMISIRVTLPLCRNGLTKKSASTKAPNAAPIVNHQAETPKAKASWALPTVA